MAIGTQRWSSSATDVEQQKRDRLAERVAQAAARAAELKAPPKAQHTQHVLPENYVTTTAGLLAICADARATGFIALDTEFHLEKSFFIHLALIQVAVGGKIYCVDPLSSAIDLRPLEELISDESVCKILHAAKMDLQARQSQGATDRGFRRFTSPPWTSS